MYGHVQAHSSTSMDVAFPLGNKLKVFVEHLDWSSVSELSLHTSYLVVQTPPLRARRAQEGPEHAGSHHR